MTLETVTIPASRVPPSATYIADVLHYGHRPGVLSGANLRGKARKYGAYYAKARRTAEALAKEYGVSVGYASINRGTATAPAHRNCRVWVKDGKPVELVVV